MFSSRKNMRRSSMPPIHNYYQQPHYNHYPQAYGGYHQNPNQAMQMPYQQPFNQNVPYPTPFSTPYPTPYPTQPQPPYPQQQSPGFQSIMEQFKNKDGTYNIDKMMNTAGQMMGAVNQIGSMVSGLSKTFKV